MEDMTSKYPEPEWESTADTPGDYYDRKANALRVWWQRYVTAKRAGAPDWELDYLRRRIDHATYVGD